jgi:hypothetical protein
MLKKDIFLRGSKMFYIGTFNNDFLHRERKNDIKFAYDRMTSRVVKDFSNKEKWNLFDIDKLFGHGD